MGRSDTALLAAEAVPHGSAGMAAETGGPWAGPTVSMPAAARRLHAAKRRGHRYKGKAPHCCGVAPASSPVGAGPADHDNQGLAIPML